MIIRWRWLPCSIYHCDAKERLLSRVQSLLQPGSRISRKPLSLCRSFLDAPPFLAFLARKYWVKNCSHPKSDRILEVSLQTSSLFSWAEEILYYMHSLYRVNSSSSSSMYCMQYGRALIHRTSPAQGIIKQRKTREQRVSEFQCQRLRQ